MADEDGIERFRNELERTDAGPFVLCFTGLGRLTGQDEHFVTVKLVDEEEPFHLEPREIQLVSPWLVISIFNWREVFFGRAYFAPNQQFAETLAAHTLGEDETRHIIDLRTGRVTTNQILGVLFNDQPYVRFSLYINRFGPIELEFSESREEAVRHFKERNEGLAGSSDGLALDLLLDFSGEEHRLLGIQLLAVMKVLIPLTIFSPEGGIVPAPKPDPEPDG